MPTLTQTVKLRCSDGEKARWVEQAGGSRHLSDWIRRVLNKQSDLDVVATTPISVAPVRDSCPRAHFHRPGSYCGTCGKTS